MFAPETIVVCLASNLIWELILTALKRAMINHYCLFLYAAHVLYSMYEYNTFDIKIDVNSILLLFAYCLPLFGNLCGNIFVSVFQFTEHLTFIDLHFPLNLSLKALPSYIYRSL